MPPIPALQDLRLRIAAEQVRIPNPHGADPSVALARRILRRAGVAADARAWTG